MRGDEFLVRHRKLCDTEWKGKLVMCALVTVHLILFLLAGFCLCVCVCVFFYFYEDPCISWQYRVSLIVLMWSMRLICCTTRAYGSVRRFTSEGVNVQAYGGNELSASDGVLQTGCIERLISAQEEGEENERLYRVISGEKE